MRSMSWYHSPIPREKSRARVNSVCHVSCLSHPMSLIHSVVMSSFQVLPASRRVWLMAVVFRCLSSLNPDRDYDCCHLIPGQKPLLCSGWTDTTC